MKTGYILMKNGDKIEFELYEDAAPNTVSNFTKLANDHFYDGLTFHRVIPICQSRRLSCRKWYRKRRLYD